MDLLLVKVGYTGRFAGESVNNIPDYRVPSNGIKTSDRVPGKTPKIHQNVYTGNELLGLATMSKSNTIPIRKDNKQAAIDVAQMRRN